MRLVVRRAATLVRDAPLCADAERDPLRAGAHASVKHAGDNPFERYDLDPRDGIATITQRLKELAEEARDDAERERIREAWEELTLHPARRSKAALFAHPETREPLGLPPSFPRRRALAADDGLRFREIAPRPSVLATLDAAAAGPPSERDEVPSLDGDEVLRSALVDVDDALT